MEQAVVLVAFSSFLSVAAAQFLGTCPILNESDLGNTTSYTRTGLLAESLNSVGQEGEGIYQLVDYNIVCLAQGSRRDEYNMASVIASYLTPESTTLMTAQFHFQCDSGQWSIVILDTSGIVTFPPEIFGNLNTTLRTDCRYCHPQASTPTEHCGGKYLH